MSAPRRAPERASATAAARVHPVGTPTFSRGSDPMPEDQALLARASRAVATAPGSLLLGSSICRRHWARGARSAEGLVIIGVLIATRSAAQVEVEVGAGGRVGGRSSGSWVEAGFWIGAGVLGRGPRSVRGPGPRSGVTTFQERDLPRRIARGLPAFSRSRVGQPDQGLLKRTVRGRSSTHRCLDGSPRGRRAGESTRCRRIAMGSALVTPVPPVLPTSVAGSATGSADSRIWNARPCRLRRAHGGVALHRLVIGNEHRARSRTPGWTCPVLAAAFGEARSDRVGPGARGQGPGARGQGPGARGQGPGARGIGLHLLATRLCVFPAEEGVDSTTWPGLVALPESVLPRRPAVGGPRALSEPSRPSWSSEPTTIHPTSASSTRRSTCPTSAESRWNPCSRPRTDRNRRAPIPHGPPLPRNAPGPGADVRMSTMVDVEAAQVLRAVERCGCTSIGSRLMAPTEAGRDALSSRSSPIGPCTREPGREHGARAGRATSRGIHKEADRHTQTPFRRTSPTRPHRAGQADRSPRTAMAHATAPGSASTSVVDDERGRSSRAVARGDLPLSQEEVRRCPTLPRGPPRSTIGAESLSFRVRNVTGRFPLAMAAETLLMFRSAHSPLSTVVADGEPGGVCVPDRPSGTTKWTRAAAHSHAPPLSWGRSCQVVGLLVPVSCTGLSSLLPHPAYQPSRLLGASHPLGAWKSHLEDGFPLRCFQRLSGPNVANQQCSWRNN